LFSTQVQGKWISLIFILLGTSAAQARHRGSSSGAAKRMAQGGGEEGRGPAAAGDDTSVTSAAASLPSAPARALEPAPEATLAANGARP